MIRPSRLPNDGPEAYTCSCYEWAKDGFPSCQQSKKTTLVQTRFWLLDALKFNGSLAKFRKSLASTQARENYATNRPKSSPLRF